MLFYKAGLLLGNKVADAVTKYEDDKIEKQEPDEEIFIPTGKKRWKY